MDSGGRCRVRGRGWPQRRARGYRRGDGRVGSVELVNAGRGGDPVLGQAVAVGGQGRVVAPTTEAAGAPGGPPGGPPRGAGGLCLLPGGLVDSGRRLGTEATAEPAAARLT